VTTKSPWNIASCCLTVEHAGWIFESESCLIAALKPPRAIRGVLAARDITDQKDWEIELATSRERLTMAMTSARMGSYEWEPDSDRVLWDEQHLAITGLTELEMTGTEFLSLVHPDDVEPNRLAIERTIRGEADYDTEFRIIRPDGQIRWLAARGKIVPADCRESPQIRRHELGHYGTKADSGSDQAG
jgi:PAS domain S-box-containing protein